MANQSTRFIRSCMTVSIALSAAVAGTTVVAEAAPEDWGPIEEVGAGPYGEGDPDLALDPDGDPAVVWLGSDEKVRFRASDNGVWGSVEVVGRGYQAPRLSIDPAGVVTVVYNRWRDGYGPEVVTKDRRPNGTWTGVQVLSRIIRDDGAYTGARMETFAANRQGAAIATWWWGSLDGGPVPRTQVAYRSSAGNWTPFKDLHKPSWTQFLHDSFVRPGGNATVVLRTASGGAVSRTRVVGDGWGPRVRVSDGPVGRFVLANAQQGQLYGVRSEPRSDGVRVHIVKLVDGAWSGVASFKASTYNGLRSLDAFGAADGTLSVAWLDATRVVRARQLNPDGTLEPAAHLSDAGVRSSVTLAGNAAGDLVATWLHKGEDPDYLGYQEAARRGRNATTWTPSDVVSAPTEVVASWTRWLAAVAASGQAYVMWEGQADGSSEAHLQLRRTG